MPIVKADDVDIYYEVHGQGEPLLLIGGLGSDITFLAGLTRRLAERFRVIVFDNRGSGRSGKPDIPYSIEMMAADAANLLESLDIRQANILGISMGGRIALALALNHPALVSSLILVSTAAKSRGKIQMSLPFRVLSLFSWLPVLKGKYPQPRYAFERQRQASLDFDVSARLGEIAAPAIVMHGRKDRSIPFELGREMQAGIRNSKLLAFVGGHVFFMMKERGRFIDAVFGFLAEVSSS